MEPEPGRTRPTQAEEGALRERPDEATFRATASGRILAVSPAAARMLGYDSPEQLLGEVPDARELWVHPARRDDLLRILQRRGSIRDFKIHAKRRDGRTMLFAAEVRLSRLSGGIQILEGTLVDIADRGRKEAALKAGYAHEHEAGDRLRDLDELKNAFLRSVGHEVRAPVAEVLTLAETLALVVPSASPERSAELVAQLLRSARRLDRLMTDLLDLDRLSRGIVRADRSPTEVEPLVREVLQRLDVSSHPTHVSVPAGSVLVDPVQLEHILENLIGNAIRHTPAGTAIDVHAELSDGGLLMMLDDQGPGVPDHLKERIFEPFERGDTPRGLPGTGIGLALVGQFASLHGGRAWVEDRAGGGASFRVWLPVEGDAAGGDEP